MSKIVTISEVNFELLSRHVPGLLAGDEALKTLSAVIATTPETIDAQGYSELIEFLSGKLLSDDHRDKELAELGISEIEHFHPTYRAVVFMELLWEIMPEKMDSPEHQLYRFTKEDFLFLSEILLLYKELFLQHEEGKGSGIPAYEVSLPVREAYTTYGRYILEREIKSRHTLGEDYSGKWFAQYFHFFETIDAEGLRASVLNGKGDVYLVEDSY